MTRGRTKSRVYGPIENGNGAFEVMVVSDNRAELRRVFISRDAAEAWIKQYPEGDARGEDPAPDQLTAENDD
jgi:hypothetical protein